ncbi:MAG: 1-(5-phosphoribosyl)-5-[(5-phosphoribosylamino)methylideneamino]imidazole-4-carboxamide isomerase [Ruminococcaceae bacterium]|nr:1-(5-phosphoribosyl)-5-[(5-phosphoribosylamino)methylideneamino]imidazole-4-carboxamide isomerase [Oscillospiraceae bacterium]
MNIFPAIDLFGGKAVRLYKGDYAQMTVYNDDPVSVADDFKACGAKHIHLVDLEGAKSGVPANQKTIKKICATFGGFVEVGGGIRNMDTVDAYINAGVDRVILGTAAVTDKVFLKNAIAKHGNKIAVGVDLKDGYVAIKGWTEVSDITAKDFFEEMTALGVTAVICTDISKDGAMQGTNRELYKELSGMFDIDIIASGGVSSIADVRALTEMGIYGAIIGKAYYTGAIDLKEAVEVAK